MPDISHLLDNDLDKITNNFDSDDDGDGIEDIKDDNPFKFEILPVTNQVITSPASMPTLVNLQFNLPQYRIIYVKITNWPLHGDLSGEYPNYVYIPEPGYTGYDSLSYFAYSSVYYCPYETNCQIVFVDSSKQTTVSLEVLPP